MFEFNDDTKWILGRPNFACIQIAETLRALGQDIPSKAEEEQAAAIYWMLSMYEKYGEDWREKGHQEMLDNLNEAAAKAVPA